jgi:hypothetical protein
MIENTENDMKYIGSTIHTLRKRFSEHKCSRKDGSLTSKFYTEMRAIGVEKFSIKCLEVVEYADVKDLRKREFEIMGTYNKEFLYNMDTELGGRSEEHQAKITSANTGKTRSEEVKVKISTSKQKGGCFTIIEDKSNIIYRYTKNGKKTSKSFSYAPRSHITRAQAMILAQAFQRELFPHLFTSEED